MKKVISVKEIILSFNLADKIKNIRHYNKYFIERRKTSPYAGDVSRKKYLVMSEEMPFLFLPLIRKALQEKRDLFFIERGGYPQKKAVEIALKSLGLEDKIKLYSYKLNGTDTSDHSTQYLLSNMLEDFFKNFCAQKEAKKLEKKEQIAFNKIFFEFDPAIQQKITANLKKYYHQFSSFADLSKNLTRGELLTLILKSEPAEVFIDHTKAITNINRVENPKSVQYKLRVLGGKIPFTKELINDKEKQSPAEQAVTEQIYNNMQGKFKDGISQDNYHDFADALCSEIHKYSLEKIKTFNFETIKLLKFLANSLNLNLNAIFCDDSIGTGKTFYNANLFNKIFSDNKFKYNVFELEYDENPHSPLTMITSAVFFPEDSIEMHNCFYEKKARNNDIKLVRHTFSDEAKAVSKKELKQYNLFLETLDNAIASNHDFQNILKDDLLKGFTAKFKDKENLRYIFLYLLNEADELNSAFVQDLGHNIFKTKLHTALKKAPINFTKIKDKYLEILPIHHKITAQKLLDKHNYFLAKMNCFSDFLAQNKKEIVNYLNSPVTFTDKNELLTHDFMPLLTKFYQEAEKKPVVCKGY